jgi:hypothetical protein
LDTSAIRSERLRQVYAYWAAKIVGGRLPSRASIDPIEIPRLLPYLFLVDVERDPQRFRFRLVGTQVCSWAGRDTTGLYTDEPAYGLRGPELTRLYAEVVARRAPLCSERPGGRPEPDLVFYDEVVLPLSADGDTVNMLFCAADMLVTTPAMRAGATREIWGRSYGR